MSSSLVQGTKYCEFGYNVYHYHYRYNIVMLDSCDNSNDDV